MTLENCISKGFTLAAVIRLCWLMCAVSQAGVALAQDIQPGSTNWVGSGNPTAPDGFPTNLLAHLKPGHPRLFAGAADWMALRGRRDSDAELARLIGAIEREGRSLLKQPALGYQKQGRRLLAVSREALRRIATWSFCYRLTGGRAFLDRAESEMLDLASFRDWNPSHFLDTAEMTAALAIGYDWLYDGLDPRARDTIRRAIVEKGLLPGTDPKSSFTGWQRTENNWNQVCFGGLTLGALAIADEEPVPARRSLERARAGISHGLRPYAPDGVYPEGQDYWEYGTAFQVLMIAALETALGENWNLDASPGFLASATAQLQMTGPSGRPFNFSDGHDAPQFKPALFWFARRLHQPELLFYQRQRVADIVARGGSFGDEGRFLPFIALWWDAMPKSASAPALPTSWLGDGPNPIGVFRSSWTDSNALYLAFKGGSAGLSHAHMDAGSFVLEADGVRWACDLGAQDYESIESKGWNLWSREQNSDRWRVFRLNNFSHNTLTLGGQLHRVNGDARIVGFNPGPTPGAAIDLSPVFAGQAAGVVRRFQVGADRSVLIRDELTGLSPGTTVRWTLVTRAGVDLARDHAILRQDGRTLQARLLAPRGAVFGVMPADPPDDGVNAPNPGARMLVINTVASASGQLRLDVVLRPGEAPLDATLAELAMKLPLLGTGPAKQ
jgi:hypothetical protein